MKRIEIIYSQALGEDLLEALKDIPAAQFYSVIPGVRGKGYSTPKMGDPVWPEINEMMIIYCDEKSEEKISAAIRKLQQIYTSEGLAFFVM